MLTTKRHKTANSNKTALLFDSFIRRFKTNNNERKFGTKRNKAAAIFLPMMGTFSIEERRDEFSTQSTRSLAQNFAKGGFRKKNKTTTYFCFKKSENAPLTTTIRADMRPLHNQNSERDESFFVVWIVRTLHLS